MKMKLNKNGEFVPANSGMGFGKSDGLSRSKIKQVMPNCLRSGRLHGGGYEDSGGKYNKGDIKHFFMWFVRNFAPVKPIVGVVR